MDPGRSCDDFWYHRAWWDHVVPQTAMKEIVLQQNTSKEVQHQMALVSRVNIHTLDPNFFSFLFKRLIIAATAPILLKLHNQDLPLLSRVHGY